MHCFLYLTSLTETVAIPLILYDFKETLNSWQVFESEREAVWSFLTNINNELHEDLTFNSLDSLKTELEQSKVCMRIKRVCTRILCMLWICVSNILASFFVVGSPPED